MKADSSTPEAIVAPFVGAWIEISSLMRFIAKYTSLPSWERGLKFTGKNVKSQIVIVAPFVGAWIEM